MGPDAPPSLRAWLAHEQTDNERIVNRRVHAAITGRGNDVAAPYRPEDRHSWPLDVVWLPSGETRAYGFPAAQLESLLGVRTPGGKLPLFVHPQSRRLYRSVIAAHGSSPSALMVTPTASYRSLAAWDEHGRGAILKVSLGATIGRIPRALREDQIARALLVNELLDAIPEATREKMGVSWFAEVAGVVVARQRHGWLLRALPPALQEPRDEVLVPAFSLISALGQSEPMLVELIRASRERPEAFVAKHVLAPYVNALAFLLLGEGIELEGHTQNVLYTVGAGGLTGRVVLRDWSDASINVALRVARGRPLPRPRRGFFPAQSRFPFVSNAADYRVNDGYPVVQRASATVDRYGLGSFVWAVNHSLARFFPDYSAPAVEHAYLDLWQRAVVGYLGVMPLHRPRRRGRLEGIAIDEAIAYFLEHTDWSALGARASSLPRDGVEPVRITARARRAGRRYQRVRSDWGDLFIEGGRPAFFGRRSDAHLGYPTRR